MDNLYLNHLKSSHRFNNGRQYIAINKTSCYFLNEITNNLIDLLPAKGSKNDYIDFFIKNDIKDGPQIFEKLVSSGVITKQEKQGLKEFVLKLISPDIELISSFRLEKLFKVISLCPLTTSFKKSLIIFTVIFFICNFLLLFQYGIKTTGNGYLIFALVLIGSMIHEIGHSFMMYVNGLGARNIGLFFYLIYPSFYVNMSGIEKLNSLDKFLANAGGFIFQSAYCLILMSIYLLTGSKILFSAYLYSCLLMLFNLNPFIRTDGYWLYRDFVSGKKDDAIWAGINKFYLFTAFLFTLYFSWHLIGNLISIILNQTASHNFKLGIKDLFMAYIGIMSIKALINKAKEFFNDLYIMRSVKEFVNIFPKVEKANI